LLHLLTVTGALAPASTALSQAPKLPGLGHQYTTFRVRIEGLEPQTTYYYTVASEESNGKSDGVKSTVNQFVTPAPGERIVGARP